MLRPCLRALAVSCLCACAREEPARVLAVDARAPETPAPEPVDASAEPDRSAPLGGEARRDAIARLEDAPYLAPYLPRLRAHFGADAKGPFAVQRVDLPRRRGAILVSRADETHPIVLVTDGDRIDWEKARPTAGILPPVPRLALSPHTSGGAILFAFVPSVHLVAARIWAEDANPFAEIEVMPIEACDALSAAWWPGKGWLVVASSGAGARAQLLREAGTLAWPAGIDVGAPWRKAAPVTIVVDTPGSVMLLQHASLPSGGDHVIARRWDASARPLWAAAIDVGTVPTVENTGERVEASRVKDGVVRVELPRGAALRPEARAVEIDAAGVVRVL